MTLEEFCTKLASLDLTQVSQALSILWYHDEKQPDTVMSAGQLARVIHDSGLGNPHSTKLGDAIKATGKVIATTAGYRLKVLARTEIRGWIASILGETKPSVDQELGYLSREVW